MIKKSIQPIVVVHRLAVVDDAKSKEKNLWDDVSHKFFSISRTETVDDR